MVPRLPTEQSEPPLYPPAPAPSPRPPRTLWGNRPSFAASASTTPYAAAFLERKTQHYNNKFSISIIYITRYTAYAQLNSHNQQRNVRPQTITMHNRGRDHDHAQQATAGPSITMSRREHDQAASDEATAGSCITTTRYEKQWLTRCGSARWRRGRCRRQGRTGPCLWSS